MKTHTVVFGNVAGEPGAVPGTVGMRRGRKLPGTASPHGSRNRYMLGCRCVACKETGRRIGAEWRAARVANAQPGHPGDANLYRAGCRCGPCREAHAELRRIERAERKGTLPPNDPRHGTPTGRSWWGCDCGPCIEADRLRRWR